MSDRLMFLVAWPGESEVTEVVAETRRQAAEQVFLAWVTDSPAEAALIDTVVLSVRSKCGRIPAKRFRVSLETRAVSEGVSGG